MKHVATLSETHIKIIFFALLIGVLGGIHLLIPDFYRTVWDLSVSGNLDGTIEYISAANGVLFGIAAGTVISWLAETIGVVISFFFMRTLFRHKAKELIEKSRMLSKLDEYSTLKSMAVARALPYSPNGLITALGALSSISYRDYILGTLIGKLPSVAVEVVVGHDVVMLEDNAGRLTVLIVIVVIVYGGLWYWNRRQKAKKVLEQLKRNMEKK